MKLCSVAALLVAGAVLGFPEAVTSGESTAPGAPPPLTVDTSAPLLLDEPAPAEKAAARISTPNLICYDCHGVFRDEPLAVRHAKEEVTCVDCHGESHEHAEDEGNVTPPSTMFARDAIATACRECHKTHDAPAADVIARWQQRGLQKLTPTDMVCTDCHGEHRLRVRTIHWDKKTGKLLPANKSPANTPETNPSRDPRSQRAN